MSAGYGDGYPRHAPNGTPVGLLGQTAPLTGRVSMDMLCIDVTEIPGAQIGTAVELWGNQISVNRLAESCGTIGYELLTGVTARVQRQYL